MKKSCLDCKALNDSSRSSSCNLKYKTQTYNICGMPIGLKPLEECPKPKTTKEYMKLYSLMLKS